ncbi:transcription antitermination factor NusB [Candidatus Bipolaricaulota bacterium]|nr:transcription antitermination factor NusB [Candidatus Bipolaricaulota bacterium]
MLRREARKEVLKALYGSEFVKSRVDLGGELLAEDPGEQEDFIQEVYEGTLDHREEIDELISSFTVGWKVERLAVLDRNILRMAIYEMLYSEETPAAVVMNEAIELAKEYGTDQAPKFINGILDRIWKESESPEEDVKN